ncbi:MAG: RagB/SusD family nutrient uptake outer membrane protein, partial [Bacteroidales bacterium]|nr:RagB/SusD family nutrient uptake outer membrane protein [Bacteroidales bacterium]
MKKIFAIFTAVICLSGCSLKEELMSNSRNEDFYNNAVQCQTGINACYNLIRSQLSGQNFWFVTDCQTDCMIMNASTFYNATLNFSPSRPAIASTIWQYSYMGVMRCNSMIYAIERCRVKGGCTDAEALDMTAETVTLRAFFYYMLTCTFGNVPFYTDVVTEENRARIASLPRMSANDTRDYLIDELMHYALPRDLGGIGAMAMKRSYDAPINNRMNAPIALMLAAKMCLWNERWEDAITVIGALERIYGDYSANPEAFGKDYPLTDIPFSRKFTPESILEIANTFEEYGTQLAGYIAVVATPSKGASTIEDEEEEDYEITDIYGGLAIPELGTGARISTSARPTTYYFETVLSYDSPDLRGGEYSADATVARGGSGNLAWRWISYERDDTERDESNHIPRWFKNGSSLSATTLNKLNRPWLGN